MQSVLGIQVVPHQVRYSVVMSVASERILFEDNWLLAVNKLGGELVVAGRGQMHKLPLLDFLKKDYPTITPIHRLDFETSGVVVFSKTKRVVKTVVDAKFAGWKKDYMALVLGAPSKPQGTITIKLPARSSDGTVAAETHYKIIERFRDATLVQCTIEHGQKHQIRKHMSMIGHPLLLDQEYGNEKINRMIGRFFKMNRFFLHASRVTFPHPAVADKIVTIDCALPPSFEGALRKLRTVK